MFGPTGESSGITDLSVDGSSSYGFPESPLTTGSTGIFFVGAAGARLATNQSFIPASTLGLGQLSDTRCWPEEFAARIVVRIAERLSVSTAITIKAMSLKTLLMFFGYVGSVI